MKKFAVVLVEPNHPGNIGAVARVMANFGLSELVIVNPRCKLSEEAEWRAKHAVKIVKKAKIVESFNEAIKDSDLVIGTTGKIGSDFNVPRSPLLPSEVSEMLKDKKGKIVLVFGREDDGLHNDEIKQCDFIVNIPTKKKYPIMNLSHAVAVLLYELTKDDNDIREKHKLSTEKENKEMKQAVDDLIESNKFRTPENKETQRLVWRKVLAKSLLTRREAFAMIGFLKKLKK